MSDQQPTGPDPQRADEQEATGGRTRGFSRRRLVAGTGLAGMLGIAGFGGAAIGRATADRGSGHSELTYPFRGDRQAGILTPAQDNMYFAAFDLDTDDVENVKEVLGEWTVAAEQMCAGELVGGEPDANPNRPPNDTGEAWGYPPAGLTITCGARTATTMQPRGCPAATTSWRARSA